MLKEEAIRCTKYLSWLNRATIKQTARSFLKHNRINSFPKKKKIKGKMDKSAIKERGQKELIFIKNLMKFRAYIKSCFNIRHNANKQQT